MTNIRGACLALSLLTSSSLGCSFILDFDKLQSGRSSVDSGLPNDTPPDTSGADGGDDGTCSESCDDGDPCTLNLCRSGRCENPAKSCTASSACVTAECVGGECQESAVVGLVPDGFEEVVAADEILRSDLVGASDRFYRATFGTFDGKRDVALASFGATGSEGLDEVRVQSLITGAEVEMGSPVSLVPDTRLDFTLNAYAAVKSANTQAGNLLRLRFDRSLQVKAGDPIIASSPNYRFASERMGPSGAQLLTGDPFVVWAGSGLASSGIYVQRGDEVVDTTLPTFVAGTGISGIASIYGGDSPGAVWMTNGANGVELEVAILGATSSVPTPLVQCHQDPTHVGYQLDVSQSISDIWTVSWTKRNGSKYVTEVSAIVCKTSGCTDLTSVRAGQSCSAALIEDRVLPDVRHLLTRTMRRQGDPDNVFYRALLFATQSAEQDVGALAMRFERLEYDLNQDEQDAATRLGQDLVLAANNLATAPNWPALALLAPDKVAVSWVEPLPEGAGDELHVQRHRICFPE